MLFNNCGRPTWAYINRMRKHFILSTIIFTIYQCYECSASGSVDAFLTVLRKFLQSNAERP